MIGLPFLINFSFVIDNIKNISALKQYKFYLIYIVLNTIWFIITMIFGIKIGIQSLTGIINFVDIILLLFFISKANFEEKDKTKIQNEFKQQKLEL